MSEERDTLPARELDLTDVLVAIGQCASKEDYAAIVKTLGHLTNEVNALRKALEGDELVERVVRRVVQQLGNGAG